MLKNKLFSSIKSALIAGYAMSAVLGGAFVVSAPTPAIAFVHQDASNCVSHEGYENNDNNVVFYNSCSTRVLIHLRRANSDGSDHVIGCSPGRCSVTVHRSRVERFRGGHYCAEHTEWEYKSRDGSC